MLDATSVLPSPGPVLATTSDRAPASPDAWTRERVNVLTEWKAAFNTWLKSRDRAALATAWGDLAADEDPAQGTVKLPNDLGGDKPRVRDALLFLEHSERTMVERMKKFLREDLKCAALVTNCNAWTNGVIVSRGRLLLLVGAVAKRMVGVGKSGEPAFKVL